jgi:hypothetical protein
MNHEWNRLNILPYPLPDPWHALSFHPVLALHCTALLGLPWSIFLITMIAVEKTLGHEAIWALV